MPHTWNNLDGQDGGSNYYRGIGWYRRHYTPPADAAGKKIYLQFDGANIVTDVYVNGTLLGQHRGGFGRFRFDATAALHVGADNVIAVKVSNASVSDVGPLSGDFTFFGGVYRDLHALIVDPLHVDVQDYASSGVYVDTTNVSAASATVRARVRVRNDRAAAASVTVTTRIADASGARAATLTATGNVNAGATVELEATASIANPHLWNGRADPYLYTAEVEVAAAGAATDRVVVPFGFRWFSVDHNSGLSLNGKAVDVHGVNRHQDRLDMGWAIGDAQHDEDFALIKEMGANAVRLSHYPHAHHVYDLCDQIGLVTWAEIPMVNTWTNSTAYTDNATQQMRELIRQQYNHPSILFWGVANEERNSPDPNPLIALLNDLVHAEDPSRLSTLASDRTDDDAINWHTDLVGFNKYYGWYSGAIGDFGPWLDTIHQARATGRVSVSEYGAGSSISTHTLSPAKGDHSEEYQNLFHEGYWKALASRPFVWGKFIWNMFDFAVDERDEGDHAGRNDKGLVTYDRKTKKDAFFWYKANWTTDPVVYITSRRFMTRTSATTTVTVYSNASSVELKVNGTSAGSKTSTDHIFTWTTITLKSGANQIQATGTVSSVVTSDTVTWTLN